MRRQSYSLEEWEAILSGYGEAAAFAAKIWVPGLWALAGALALPLLVLLIHAVFRRRSVWLRLAIAPLAGGFAGGYAFALKLQGQTCEKFKGILCVIQSPDLANIILGAMVCVVAVYLAFPGKKIPPVGITDDGSPLLRREDV